MLLWKVIYRDARWTYEEVFLCEDDAKEFMRSLKRSPDIIKSAMLLEFNVVIENEYILDAFEV